ncbi:MAG: tyrosine-type recombinase/integrase [Firmicutes bacterium]|nr:tyrosine-type recombinase/integrase [Bacillota bacterium]
MAGEYFNERNRKHTKELWERLENMPEFVRDYFIAVETTTTALTRSGYATDLAIFLDFLMRVKKNWTGKEISELDLEDLNTVTGHDIERFLSYLSYYSFNGKEYQNDNRAKARKLSAIRSLFKYYYVRGNLKQDVSSKVSTPKIPEKPIIRLENNEVKQLLDDAESDSKFGSNRQDLYNLHTRERDFAILTLLLATGIRVSECVGLNVDDIDLKNNSFSVTRKGGAQSILYFAVEAKEALLVYLEERERRLKEKGAIKEKALFISLQNKRMTVRAMEYLVKKYSKLVAPLKKISPHKLRSTYGTALYRSTKDIYVVAEVLGHKDINTTKKHYAAISEDIKREASKKVVLRDRESED